jgi:hypothetical protein
MISIEIVPDISFELRWRTSKRKSNESPAEESLESKAMMTVVSN